MNCGMLTASEIKKQMKNGNIVISPFNEKQLNPNSYNITLNNKILIYKTDLIDSEYNIHGIDSYKNNETEEFIIPEEGIILMPNTLYIASTNEYTKTNNFIPCIDGRSSIGRLGICIHVSAGFGDLGFEGTWTLEISVIHPTRIYPNMEIGQIYYFSPCGEVEKTYEGRYQNQVKPVSSRLYIK